MAQPVIATIWVGPTEGDVVDGGDRGEVLQSIIEQETVKSFVTTLLTRATVTV